jgi:hypothetical protein
MPLLPHHCLTRHGHAIQLALDAACARAHTASSHGSASEPACVYVLMSHLIAALNSDVRNEVARSGVDLSAAGAFIHQRPIVKTTGATSGCELGDLLVVIEHRGLPIRALMYQAKKVTPHLPNDVQFTLYNDLPQFNYTKGFCANSTRHITGRMQSAAQYLIISSTAATPEYLSVWADPIYHTSPIPKSITLSQELVNLLSETAGGSCRRDDGHSWGRVIRDLLSSNVHATLKAVSSLRGAKGSLSGKPPRVLRFLGSFGAVPTISMALWTGYSSWEWRKHRVFSPEFPREEFREFEPLYEDISAALKDGYDPPLPNEWGPSDESDGGISTVTISIDA